MVIHRLELCITMVRMAIEFVMSVAETVVIVQQRTSEPLATLNRASTPLPFYGFLRWISLTCFLFFLYLLSNSATCIEHIISFSVHQTLIDANPRIVVRKIVPLFFGFWYTSCLEFNSFQYVCIEKYLWKMSKFQ